MRAQAVGCDWAIREGLRDQLSPIGSGRNSAPRTCCRLGLTSSGTPALARTSLSRSTPGAISMTVRPSGQLDDAAFGDV